MPSSSHSTNSRATRRRTLDRQHLIKEEESSSESSSSHSESSSDEDETPIWYFVFVIKSILFIDLFLNQSKKANPRSQGENRQWLNRQSVFWEPVQQLRVQRLHKDFQPDGQPQSSRAYSHGRTAV